VPPGDIQDEAAKLARETFPDIKDPYVTVRAEAGQAAKLLADRGLAVGIGHSANGSQAAGNPLIACDAYGSRSTSGALRRTSGSARATPAHRTGSRWRRA
jgi:hypothetical protein